GEDRPDADVRVARRDHDQARALERLEDARRGRRRVGPLEMHALGLLAVLARDEPLLERERTVGGRDPRAETVVGRRHQMKAETQPLCEPRRDPRQRHAAAKRLRPHEMKAEVAVAEPEPLLAPEALRLLERVPRLVRPAPAPLLVTEAGKRVEDAVQIGRDMETEYLHVVADVA